MAGKCGRLLFTRSVFCLLLRVLSRSLGVQWLFFFFPCKRCVHWSICSGDSAKAEAHPPCLYNVWHWCKMQGCSFDDIQISCHSVKHLQTLVASVTALGQACLAHLGFWMLTFAKHSWAEPKTLSACFYCVGLRDNDVVALKRGIFFFFCVGESLRGLFVRGTICFECLILL